MSFKNIIAKINIYMYANIQNVFIIIRINQKLTNFLYTLLKFSHNQNTIIMIKI
jgi:hypothetical protein